MHDIQLALRWVLFLVCCSFPLNAEASNSIRVGAYYFPGWSSSSEYWKDLEGQPGSRSTVPWPERMPLGGRYAEENQGTADRHLIWAKTYGLSYFIYDWYWEQGREKSAHAVRNFLSSNERQGLQYMLLWANHPRIDGESEFLTIVRHWADYYLAHPEYLTIQGRPAVIVFSPDHLRNQLGGSRAVRQAFVAADQMLHKRGIPPIFWLGCAYPNQVGQLLKDGYAAATAYNYPRAGMGVSQDRVAPYRTMISGYEQYWHDFAADGRLLYWVPVSSGWDPRPWQGRAALIRPGSTPEAFGDMLIRALRFANAFPSLTNGMVVINAWNEFAEGASIEPTEGWGFAYLAQVRKALNAFLTHEQQ